MLSGRSLPHAMMMIPEPWEKHDNMDDDIKAFYEYHSCLMEPWDWPASIAFTDGKIVGATLDRNGLRPSRYYVTNDDTVVLSSEVGVLDIPSEDSRFDPAKNIIFGNVSFYGATGGQAYIRGKAGERFCVRNSGLRAVVESVGDHACEYMTGGRVVVLGETGRNFAAGMSGGIAYILDTNHDFHHYCNTEMVELEKLRDDEEIKEVYEMIRRHAEYTDSHRSWKVLAKWQEMIPFFVKVFPRDYKRM